MAGDIKLGVTDANVSADGMVLIAIVEQLRTSEIRAEGPFN